MLRDDRDHPFRIDPASAAAGLLVGACSALGIPSALPSLYAVLGPAQATVAAGLALAAGMVGLRRPQGMAATDPNPSLRGITGNAPETMIDRLAKLPAGTVAKAVEREVRARLEPMRGDDPILELLDALFAFHGAGSVLHAVKGKGHREDVHDLLSRLDAAMATSTDVAATARAFHAWMSDRAKGKPGAERGPARTAPDPAAHAMRQTHLMEALDRARTRSGTLSCAQFAWLETVDPRLWHALNDVGRPAFTAEGIGAVCHWRAEKAEGWAIPEPRVAGAVEAILALVDARRARKGVA